MNQNPSLKYCRMGNHMTDKNVFAKDSQSSDGLYSVCKTCLAKRRTERRYKDTKCQNCNDAPATIHKRKPRHHICPQCDLLLYPK